MQPVSTQEVSPVAFPMHGHSEYRTLPPPGQGEAWLGGLLHSDRTQPFGQLHMAIVFVATLMPAEDLP